MIADYWREQYWATPPLARNLTGQRKETGQRKDMELIAKATPIAPLAGYVAWISFWT